MSRRVPLTVEESEGVRRVIGDVKAPAGPIHEVVISESEWSKTEQNPTADISIHEPHKKD